MHSLVFVDLKDRVLLKVLIKMVRCTVCGISVSVSGKLSDDNMNELPPAVKMIIFVSFVFSEIVQDVYRRYR